MFKINTKRSFTVTGEIEEGFKVSVTFNRPTKEEEASTLGSMMDDKGTIDNALAMQISLTQKRQALVGIKGFADEKGKELSLGEPINEDIQIAVFDALVGSPLWEKILKSFENVNLKNSKSGAKQS